MNKKIAIIMGSQSDYSIMHHAEEILQQFGVSFETLIISAHRTPHRLYEFCQTAKKQGFQIIIAAAGGAAHLPGMASALTELPVLGVPIVSRNMFGFDSLLSIVQMPAGVPVGTLAIGEAGAKNSALLSIAILALQDAELAKKLQEYRQKQTDSVTIHPIKNI